VGRLGGAGFGILNGDGETGKIGKEFLTEAMHLPERAIEGFPFLIKPVTELGILIAVRMGFFVLFPEKTQGHSLFREFNTEESDIGHGSRRNRTMSFGKQHPFQGLIIHPFRKRPGDAADSSSTEILKNRTVRKTKKPSYGSNPLTIFISMFQYSPYLSHG